MLTCSSDFEAGTNEVPADVKKKPIESKFEYDPTVVFLVVNLMVGVAAVDVITYP
jgi:hypothetical protein